MARIQLALNVDDLDEAIPFYERLLGVAPHKVRDGYANFAADDPPVKLVLFEVPGASETLNHLGIEVDGTSEVAAAAERFATAGLSVDVRDQETCCHATQDKVWVDGPGRHRWEVYTITDDTPTVPEGTALATACCAPTPLEGRGDRAGVTLGSRPRSRGGRTFGQPQGRAHLG